MHCEGLQSTEDFIVNVTSTTIGSKATYQCRNGSSEVYITQCISEGVWEPYPNTARDCGSMIIPLYFHMIRIQISLSYSVL